MLVLVLVLELVDVDVLVLVEVEVDVLVDVLVEVVVSAVSGQRLNQTSKYSVALALAWIATFRMSSHSTHGDVSPGAISPPLDVMVGVVTVPVGAV